MQSLGPIMWQRWMARSQAAQNAMLYSDLVDMRPIDDMKAAMDEHDRLMQLYPEYKP